MNSIDWTEELSVVIGSCIGAFIVLGGMFLTSWIKKSPRHPEERSPCQRVVPHNLQVFVAFAATFMGVTIMQDLFSIFSSSLQMPLAAKYSFGLIAALTGYVAERRKR